MPRNRKTYRFGIRRQMILIFLAVFLAGGLILSGIIHARLQQNLEDQITRELQGRQENTLIYIRQLLMLHNANNDEEGYLQIAESIVQELRGLGGRSFSVLDTQGNYLSGNSQVPGEGSGEDLELALKGDAAFSMTYPEGDSMVVYFSMPVVIEDRSLGIIRYRMDTSAQFVQVRQSERLVYQTTAFVYALTFLLLAFFINRLLVPVWKLTEISRQVVQDLSRNEVDMQMLAQLADSGRRDEVGELSRNFSVMLEMIDTQFKNMQEDKERIISLLGSRQEFYNNMTHELKTPLTTIRGYAQLMEADGGQDSELTSKGLAQILAESARMHQMVLQLLEMSDKSIYMERKLVDLAAVSRSVAQALEIKAERYNMKIETDFQEELLVWGVEDRLRQVLINLVDNAIKYGEGRSAIHMDGVRKKGVVWLAVRNRGKGLTPQEQRKVFEPFYRVDKNYSREQGSSGLGLSICRKIMEEHQGSIGVKSRPGVQTIFYIRLKGAAAETSFRKPSGQEACRGTERDGFSDKER